MNDWFEAEQRVERAQQLSESERWEEALAEIDIALSINPNHAAWHAHRGYILEELDCLEDAADAYQASLDLEPDDPDVSIALGSALGRLRRFAQAINIFERIARQFPDLEPAYCHRIAVYAELGQHDKAEEMFYLAQELDESCPHCFFSVGASLAARHQYDRAIFCWKRVLDLDPEHPGVNARIAQAHRARGERSLARDFYLSELRQDPGNTDLMYDLAELTLEAGQLDAAAARFCQILELDPDHVESHFALGKIRLRQGKPDEALTCFEAIGAFMGDDVPLPEYDAKVGEALLQMERFPSACERLRAALELDPTDQTARLLLGTCLFALGKTVPAADEFQRVLAVDAGNAIAHHRLAACMMAQRRFEPALGHALAALMITPRQVPVMYVAAVCQLHLARWQAARAMIRAALEVDGRNAALRQLARSAWRHRIRHLIGRVRATITRVMNR